MYPASRKLKLVEKILSIRNDQVLKELELVLENLKKSTFDNKASAKTFSGIWDKKESQFIETTIEEGCEKIDPNDWK